MDISSTGSKQSHFHKSWGRKQKTSLKLREIRILFPSCWAQEEARSLSSSQSGNDQNTHAERSGVSPLKYWSKPKLKKEIYVVDIIMLLRIQVYFLHCSFLLLFPNLDLNCPLENWQRCVSPLLGWNKSEEGDMKQMAGKTDKWKPCGNHQTCKQSPGIFRYAKRGDKIKDRVSLSLRVTNLVVDVWVFKVKKHKDTWWHKHSLERGVQWRL